MLFERWDLVYTHMVLIPPLTCLVHISLCRHGPLALRLATAMARLGQKERAASLALTFGLQLKL
jgi:hypothetical protein